MDLAKFYVTRNELIENKKKFTKDPSERDVVVVALDWVGEVLNEKKPEEMEKKKKKKERKKHLQIGRAHV